MTPLPKRPPPASGEAAGSATASKERGAPFEDAEVAKEVKDPDEEDDFSMVTGDQLW